MGEPAVVKICGVTRRRDARLAVDHGADLLGLNFYPPSPRFVDVERARSIADEVRGAVRLVGVFVDLPLPEVLDIERSVGLDLLQFHGDESASELRSVAGRSIKAVRFDPREGVPPLREWSSFWGLLLEPRHQRLHGGTGESWDYRQVREPMRRLLVAGGIRPSNVVRALRQSGAWGVDVCSGVESRPGLKDEGLLTELFENLHMARPE